MKRPALGTDVWSNHVEGVTMSIHALTNPATGHSFDITVPVGEDVAAVAKAYLADHDLPWDAQEGFYVSVFPTGQEAEPRIAQPPTNLDSSPTGSPYDTQSTPD
jgi:hypothetical protein